MNPEGVSALAALADSIQKQVNEYHSMAKVPPGSMVNIRNDMYLVSEGLRFVSKDKALNVSDADKKTLGAYKKELDQSTKFIPTWVKVAVAIALTAACYAGARVGEPAVHTAAGAVNGIAIAVVRALAGALVSVSLVLGLRLRTQARPG